MFRVIHMKMSYSQVVLFIIWKLLISALGSPPPNPVQCVSNNCTISSSYGIWPDRVSCTASAVVYPSSELELVAAVASGVKNNQKMKVVTKLAHSIPKLVCPGGNAGLIISTRNYNHNVFVNKDKLTVTVDSGVQLRQLIDGIAAQGYAVPYTPYWEGLSIGGLLSTGTHGSSFFGKGSALHEYVTSMSLVVPATKKQGYAKIVTFTESDEELNAARVSLGVLGVISKVTLKLERMFKRSIVNEIKADDDLEDQILPFGLSHEFGDITWYPSQKKAVYKKDDRVPITTPGDGVNDYIGFRPIQSAVNEILREIENSFEATRNAEGKCFYAQVQTATIQTIGMGLKNNDLIFTGYPVVGYQNRLQTSGSCLYTPEDGLFRACAWDYRVKGEFFHETAVSIGVSKIKSFLLDVKSLQAMDPKSLCGVDLYVGFLLRFVKASSAYLGEQEDVVNIGITYYRARSAGTPRLNEDVLEEIEQMAVFKYGGRPHWGKNRNVAFDGAWTKYAKLSRFLEVKYLLDPEGLFSSEWSDAVLGFSAGSVTTMGDNCALEGMCICSEDRHCAPEKGYFCRSGRVYTDAHVCRFEDRGRPQILPE